MFLRWMFQVSENQFQNRAHWQTPRLNCSEKLSGRGVYVLATSERVKIGWSRQVYHRVEGLLSGNPDATLVAVASGGQQQEKDIHKILESERDAGEWFNASMSDVIDAMIKVGLAVQGTTAVMDTARIGKSDSPAPTRNAAPYESKGGNGKAAHQASAKKFNFAGPDSSATPAEPWC